MNLIAPRIVTAIACLALNGIGRAADDGTFPEVIRPILKEYCNTCHSTKKQKGDLDLERFTTAAESRRHPEVWEHVAEQLANNEMPPKKELQLPAEKKAALVKWVQAMLDEVALANAGDPGPVVLRRLSNMEYTYTVRDLTGVESLDPAKEFPADGAAGEGFTNAGAALVMSPPLLTKYLDAAKDIASHAVLLPDGIRFSPSASPRDWTNEALANIRDFYAQFSEQGGAMAVNLQGIKFDTNAGGRLPVEKYVAALLKDRDAVRDGKKTAAAVAKENGLNAKYATTLWAALNDTRPSPVLDIIRARFRTASSADAASVTSSIQDWQQSLWRFASVGHIGKLNGPRGWQEPVSPLAAQSEMRVKLTAPKDGGDVTLYLSTTDAGDGSEHDASLWENARLVAPGRADLPLKDVRSVLQHLENRRAAVIASTTKCLAAAAEARAATERTDVAKLARKHGVEADVLGGWLEYLGLGTAGEMKLAPLLVKKMEGTPEYAFIKGWSGENALGVLANSSDATVRIPGVMKPHSIATHPSPKLASVIAWRSPVSGTLRIGGSVQHVHSECGNGITWALELRRGQVREQLANGVSKGAAVISMGKFENIRVLPGDVIAIVIGPRDGNHTCDLTAVDLTLNDGTNEWDLAKDVSPDILAGNPHADRLGHKDVWHFFSQPEKQDSAPGIPGGSLLAMWRKAPDNDERERLGKQVQQLLQRGLATVAADSPNRALHAQLLSFNGPLLSAALRSAKATGDVERTSPYGLDPGLFATTGLQVKAPSVIEVRLPASLADGAEFVATGRLADKEGSVQMQVLTTQPDKLSGIAASRAQSEIVKGQWSDNNLRTAHSTPILVNDGSAARRRFESAFDEFRALFPAALCYTKIVPVDEVVTLTLYHREDEQLKRLMLDDAQAAALDRMWDELHFVSESPLKQVDGFEQLYQFATQDAKPAAFEPMREPIMRAADTFRKRLIETEPKHVQAVLHFAGQAWRRALNDAEKNELRALYEKLRKQELPHAAAVRMLIARVLVAPAFLYRGENAAPGPKATPVSDWELATRMSYFLWSSAPDEELRALAASGKLHEPGVLAAQARRMVCDAKVRRLATEFGCQWLHVRDVATLEEKSERHFPTFTSVRDAMQEEAVRFFTDLFQEDRSVLSLLDADHTFVNGALAKHYGLTWSQKSEVGSQKSDGWQRVDGLRARGRGGILAFASTLAKQSGASRTSPILRGNWISEVVLGEKLPRPPKGVPVLPDEAPQGLTERRLIERHSSDAQCAKCHERIDPFGFALEGFDAIGRARSKDAGGLAIDTRVKLTEGTSFEGLDGLRSHLVNTRRDDFLRQFCRKLLGYALGRSAQLSDKPLLDTMLARLRENGCRVGTVIDLIVLSPQFREVRGNGAPLDE